MHRSFNWSIWVTFPFLLCFPVVVAQPSYADSNLFYPYFVIPTSSRPQAVAVGDVNSDSRNDVVMVTSFYSDPDNDCRLFVFSQNESGRLKPPLKYLTDGDRDHPPKTVAIGDVNNDGKADVVIGNLTKNIQVFLQDDAGVLQEPINYATVNSTSIRIADLNNDGLLDVVGIGWGPTDVHVFLQNSSGSLQPPVTYKVNYSGDEVEIGDINPV